MPEIRPGDKVRTMSGDTRGDLVPKMNKDKMRREATVRPAEVGIVPRNRRMNVTYDTTASNKLG